MVIIYRMYVHVHSQDKTSVTWLVCIIISSDYSYFIIYNMFILPRRYLVYIYHYYLPFVSSCVGYLCLGFA